MVNVAVQVAQELNPKVIIRVLLLSHGHANVGVTDTEMIAKQMAGLSTRGISTRNGDELNDVLKDLPQTAFGNWELPNLRFGQEMQVAIRIQLPEWVANAEITSLCSGWPDHFRGAHAMVALNCSHQIRTDP